MCFPAAGRVERPVPRHDLFLAHFLSGIKLEHSLVSLSKWESKWHKAFLGREPKTQEESIDYIRCMTLTQNVNPDVYKAITPQTEREVFRDQVPGIAAGAAA